MNRRNFIKGVGTSSIAAPFLLNGIPMNVMANSFATNQFSCEEVNDRVLVVVQLGGGNDGLNTFIPLDQYAQYRNLRPNIGIRDTGTRKYTQLDAGLQFNQQVALQPDALALKDIYDDGKLNIIQDVCYPNPNKSHFKSTDIWWSGKDGNTAHQTGAGWIGQYLDKRFPDYPASYPNTDMPDPFGIQLGNHTTAMGFFRQNGIPVGIPIGGDPIYYMNLVANSGGTLPVTNNATHYEKEINFINNMELGANDYSVRLANAYNAGTNTVNYPETYYAWGGVFHNNTLAPQLKTVARLISGGLKTKIFFVSLSGFDNHAGQTSSSDPSQGTHAILMYHLTEALRAFQNDLRGLGIEDKVLSVTFSEFGRTVPENGSFGTDHGTAAPMMIMGKAVIPGIIGTNPDLNNLNDNNFASWQHDYRSVFTTLLQDWLGANTASLAASELDGWESQKLPIINDNFVDPTDGRTYNFVADPLCDDAVSFPVEFLGFNVTLNENWEAVCQWATATESDNEHFVVERSLDGVAFERVGQVDSKGDSTTTTQYSFVDTSPMEGRSYYRIKQVDLDGSFSFTEVETIVIDGNRAQVSCNFYPNPVVDTLNIKCNASAEIGSATIRVSKVDGATLEQKSVNIYAGENSFKVQMGRFSPGLYFVEIFSYTNGAAVQHSWSRIIKE